MKNVFALIAVVLMLINIVAGGGLVLPTFIFTAATFIAYMMDEASEDWHKAIWGFNAFVWLMILLMTSTPA